MRTGVDGIASLRWSVILSIICKEVSRLLPNGFDDGAWEEDFAAGTLLAGRSASGGAEVNLMISFRLKNGARECSSSRLCVASFLAGPVPTTGAFFFLFLRRFASRPESRLVLGSGDGFLRAFFGSWRADSGSDMTRLEPWDTLLGPGAAGRVEEGIGRRMQTVLGRGDAPQLAGC